MRRLVQWPVVIIVSAAGAGLVVIGDLQSPIRPLIVFWFLLICPGMAFVQLIQVKKPLNALILAISFSVTIDTIVSVLMAFFKIWSPEWGLLGIMCLSLMGAIPRLVQDYKQGLSERKPRHLLLCK
jgi:hypothetical protein